MTTTANTTASQAGLISTMIDEWYFHADEHVKAKLADYSNVLLDRFAAHSADARNGDGVAYECNPDECQTGSECDSMGCRKARAAKPHNPWRESLENCANGENFLRSQEYIELIDYIDALLAAPAAPASEPAGWKLVPVRSTPEIQSAISSALFDQQVDHNLIRKLDMADIYAAIIDEAAAPAPAPAAQADALADAIEALQCPSSHNVSNPELFERGFSTAIEAAAYLARQQSATPAEPVPSRATEPPLLGHWHGGNGVICCGTLRVFGEDFDTDPAEEFKQEIMQWVCDTLNAALTPADAASEADKIDYSLARGDTVYSPYWGDGARPVEVVDVNWALRAAAVRLAPKGGIVVWPVSHLQRERQQGAGNG